MFDSFDRGLIVKETMDMAMVLIFSGAELKSHHCNRMAFCYIILVVECSKAEIRRVRACACWTFLQRVDLFRKINSFE